MAFVKHPTFWAVFIVYSGTYTAANTITSYCESKEKDKTYYKLAGTTVTNMALGITKDRYFAREFSKVKAQPMPMASIGLFFIRDVLTIGAGFTFPAMLASYFTEKNIIKDPITADVTSQLMVPIMAQTLLTPIHLLALDMYNRKGVNMLARAEKVGHLYAEGTSLRMMRVLGAYGLAGISNTAIRTRWRAHIDA